MVGVKHKMTLKAPSLAGLTDVVTIAIALNAVCFKNVNCIAHPDEVVLNMELAYYDDRTPDDYEPEGFCPSEAKPMVEAEEVGGVETKFHRYVSRKFEVVLFDFLFIDF